MIVWTVYMYWVVGFWVTVHRGEVSNVLEWYITRWR